MKCKYGSVKHEMDRAGTLPSHHISPGDYARFESLGSIHFEINDRVSKKQQIATLYCRYFAKPEHYEIVYSLLLE